MTVDLAPYLDAVPDVVVERLRGARRVLAVGHENPDADTLGATLGVVAHRRGPRRHGRPGVHGPGPAAVRLPAGHRALPDRPRSRQPPYDLLVVSDCGTLDRIGEVRGRHRRAVRAAAARRHRPSRLERRAPARPTGSSRRPPRPARWSRCWPPGSGLPLDARRRDPGRGPDGRASSWTPPRSPTPTPRPGRWPSRRPSSRPARRCPTSRAGCTAPSRTAQLRLFGRVLDRLESADGGRVDLVHAARRRPRGDRHRSRRSRRGSSTCSPRPTRPRSRSCSRRPAPATRISVRTKPGGVDATVLTGAFGGGGHARAAGATVAAPRRRGTAGRPRRGQPPRRRRSRADAWRARPSGPGLDGILVVDKPIGPTSHDIVGLVRRLAATKRVGHGGTLDPFAIGRAAAVPGPRHARRRVPPRRREGATGRRSASARRRRPTTSRAS